MGAPLAPGHSLPPAGAGLLICSAESSHPQSQPHFSSGGSGLSSLGNDEELTDEAEECDDGVPDELLDSEDTEESEEVEELLD